jgi:hypothetical protein
MGLLGIEGLRPVDVIGGGRFVNPKAEIRRPKLPGSWGLQGANCWPDHGLAASTPEGAVVKGRYMTSWKLGLGASFGFRPSGTEFRPVRGLRQASSFFER